METTIGNTKFTLKYDGDKAIIWHSKGQYVIWSNGKWTDDNRGKCYLNWRARDQLVKAFDLK